MKKLVMWMLIFLMPGAYGYAAEMKLNGFTSAQFQWTQEKATRPGFVVNEGAIYLSGEMDDASFMIDLPFVGMMQKFKVDKDGNKVGYSTNDFSFANSKPQAFVVYKHSTGASFTMGQFDTIYGFELNDQQDVFFSAPGIVFNAALPVTHTGFVTGYSTGSYGLKLLVSNANNQGVLNGVKPEIGVQATFVVAGITGAVGYLDKNDDASMNLLDIVIGAKMASFAIDFEFDMMMPKDGDAANAFMLHIVHNHSDTMQIGLRAESLSGLKSKEMMQVTFGPKFALTKALSAGLDYTWNSATYEEKDKVDLTKVTTTKKQHHTGNFGMVYRF